MSCEALKLICRLGLVSSMSLAVPAAFCGDEKKADEPVVEKQVAPSAEDKELAARADKAIPLAEGTPGQEAMNFIVYDWPGGCLKRLKGEPPTSTEKELEGARGVVKGLVETIEKGPSWPRPALIKIPHANSAIIVDGKLDEKAWQGAFTVKESFEYGRKDAAAGADTAWRMLWDEKNLYVAFDCADNEIVSKKMERDKEIFFDDCVEVFILPSFDPPEYWEIIVNPAGSVFDALHRKKLKGWGPEKTDLEKTIDGLQFSVGKRPGGDPGYTVEMAIPFSQLPGRDGKTAKAGDNLFVMLARFDKTSAGVKTYSFVPLLSWGHNIWNLAPAELVGL